MVTLTKVGKIGTVVGGIPSAADFALNPLTLNDMYGNIGQFTRAGVANSPDYQGTLIQSALDQHRVNYGHRVENLATYSEDITNSVWVKHSGLSNSGNRVTFNPNAASNAYYQWQAGLVNNIGGLFSINDRAIMLVFVRAYVGTQKFRLTIWDNLTGAVMSPDFTCDTNGSWFTWEYARQGVIPFYPAIIDNAAQTGADIIIDKFMIANVTGKPTSYIPPYVPRLTAATAAQWFDTESGLTADANNVVTGLEAGNQLHPKRTINGAETYIDIKAWVTGAFNAGDMVETGGRYYQASASGADVAFNSSGLWVDKGYYRKGFGVLLEGGTTNTVTSPNDVSISWVTTGSTFATGQTAPDESNTATLLSEDSSNGLHRATTSATPTAVGSIYTASIFLKAGTRTQATVNISGLSGGLSYVDLVTGAVIAKGISVASLHSEPYANGWYRFIVVFTATASNHPIDVLGYDGTGFSYLGNPAKNFLLWGAQVEASPYATSFIDGIRQNELGNLKFPTTQGWKGKNAFPHASGSLAVTYCPQYSSGDFAGWKAFLSMFNINKPLGVQASGVMRTNDGTNATNSSYTPIPNQNDAVQVALRWGVGADAAQPNAHMLLISLRNATTGGGWVHGVAVPYDGAFTDTGFLQLLQSLGGNNSVFRNTVVFDRPLTNNELQGYVIS